MAPSRLRLDLLARTTRESGPTAKVLCRTFKGMTWLAPLQLVGRSGRSGVPDAPSRRRGRRRSGSSIASSPCRTRDPFRGTQGQFGPVAGSSRRVGPSGSFGSTDRSSRPGATAWSKLRSMPETIPERDRPAFGCGSDSLNDRNPALVAADLAGPDLRTLAPAPTAPSGRRHGRSPAGPLLRRPGKSVRHVFDSKGSGAGSTPPSSGSSS